MLWFIIIALVVLWLLGKLLFASLGALIHLLLVLAVILFIVKIVRNIRHG